MRSADGQLNPPPSAKPDLGISTVSSDALQAVLDRRRQLLTQLFFLSTYTDVPLEQEGLDDPDLERFLATNEGHFKQSTLPVPAPRIKGYEVAPLPTLSAAVDLTLWLRAASYQPMHDLMEGANKVVTTEAWLASIQEQKWIKTCKRIEQLKQQNKWSLRQPVKPVIARRKAHHDFMLDEMAWMQTDFREERKWKMAMACEMAYAVKAWHEASDKRSLTISASPVQHLSQPTTEPSLEHPMPDLPIFGPPAPFNDAIPDSPVVPVSKFSCGAVQVKPSKKRKRQVIIPGPPSEHRRKTILTLSVRPPMPPPADRPKSTWTPEMDDALLGYVTEYQHNWDLIANALTPSNMLVAVADRKTSWDCFERWIQIDVRANDALFTGPHARLVQSKVDDLIRAPKTERRKSIVAQPPLFKKQRQFSLFDAMRKVQRKRENTTKPAVPPKKVETKTPPVVPSPAHLSQMKYERDQQIARAFQESKNQQLLAMQQQQQRMAKGPPTPAQIAQLQAARQTHARQQLAQQQHQQAQQQAQNGAVSVALNGSILNGRPVQVSRPSLVGQMPARPGSQGTPFALPNGTTLRIPAGQRLTQEQMAKLLQEARAAKGLSPGQPMSQAAQQVQLQQQQQQQQQLQQQQLAKQQQQQQAQALAQQARSPKPAPKSTEKAR
ncbi:hypothetical protein BCR37DRAFT_315049 [Protomyces lactucae-debilis]|uniref:Vacuolar import and degradation protein 21 n=1 Tax=Protomyces lactucae-debilis TaxID=2754530 RepID=A0A1Y2FEZ7_PROLT|nr:uncharacterized protein BCR37DRAFT_315049 [Protomyces lactucae-debilis]ORY82518.1 hypothetical protein BCR37DRAFT_315049 [Protomyces lactucae-debilis]